MLTGLGPLSVDMYLASLPSIGRLLGAPAAQVQLTISFYLVGLRLRAGGLRPAVRPPRPPAGAARGARPLSRRLARLRAGVFHRDADRRALSAGGRRVRRHRAGPRRGARHVRGLAHRPRAVAHGGDHGARAAGRAADRRRAADRVRLALEFRRAVRLWRRGAGSWSGSCCRRRCASARPSRCRLPRPCARIAGFSAIAAFVVHLGIATCCLRRVVRLDFRLRLRAAGHLRLLAAGVRHQLRRGLVRLSGRHVGRGAFCHALGQRPRHGHRHRGDGAGRARHGAAARVRTASRRRR